MRTCGHLYICVCVRVYSLYIHKIFYMHVRIHACEYMPIYAYVHVRAHMGNLCACACLYFMCLHLHTPMHVFVVHTFVLMSAFNSSMVARASASCLLSSEISFWSLARSSSYSSLAFRASDNCFLSSALCFLASARSCPESDILLCCTFNNSAF